MMGQTIYIEWSSRSSSWWDRRRGCSGAKSAYLSSLHLCHKNDKSFVLDLCCAAYKEQDDRTIGRDIQPTCGRSCSDLHTFVTACTWLLTWKCWKGCGTQGVWSMDRWQCCTRTEDACCREPGRRWGTRVGKRASSGFLSRQISREPQDGIFNHLNIWCWLNLMSKSAIKAKLFAWNSYEWLCRVSCHCYILYDMILWPISRSLLLLYLECLW